MPRAQPEETPIDPLAPILADSASLETRVARRSAARLGATRRRLSSRAWARLLPEGRMVLSAVSDILGSLAPPVRRRLLCGPDIRGFLGEAEIWMGVLRLAESAASARRRAAVRARLFDRVSRTEHLAALVPRRRLDPGFPARAVRFARRRLRHALSDLAALALGLRLAFPGGRPLRLTLEFRQEAEQGRPRGRIDLGAVVGPAGALGIVARRRGGRRIRADLRGRTLVLRAAGGPAVILPAAGSRLRFPDPAAAGTRPAATARGGGARRAGRSDPLRLERRETIPGTPILLAPVVLCRPRRLVVGREDPRSGPRLARALGLVRVAWPQGFREILRRTWMVVPIREPGTVSYSLAARPGISFINLSGKSILDLADDLLHETAHHLLHDLEEVEPLLPRGAEAQEVPAFHSPWRRAQRPLRGLLHGCFTFRFRAALLRRLLRASRSRPGARSWPAGRGSGWVRRELRRESENLRRGLRELERAARAGLLTPAGRRLVRRLHGGRRGAISGVGRVPPLRGRAGGPARGL